MATWSGRSSIRGGSEVMRMVLLTCNSIGVMFTWGVEMTYCTPYLLSLGLTKGQTSLVWIAGPLSGLIVQPVIGVISDKSTFKWGRRRPFIMICSVIVAMSLLTLGFTRDIVSLFLPSSVAASTADASTATTSTNPETGGLVGLLTIALAVLALYTTDFAINAVMSCARSLIVDTLPMHKQQDGAAWASRMSAIGHIIGYGAGAVDLVSLLGTTLGETQFKQLTVIAASGILFCSSVTCWAVSERVLVTPAPDDPKGSTSGAQRFKVLRQIWSTLITLPVRIRAICWAVFWSWIGWYPFLIYSSTWVGETYFRYDVPADAKNSTDALGEMGRIGSYALTVYSIITFLTAWLLPPFVCSPESDDDDDSIQTSTPQTCSWPQTFLQSRFPGVAYSIRRLIHLKPDLLSVWTFGYIMFSAAMFLAPLAASFRFATLLVALCGIPWTISMWAPTALMGVEVNRLTHGSGYHAQTYRRLSASSAMELHIPLTRDNVEDMELATVAAAPGPVPQATPDEDGNGSRGDGGGGELSGIYFGILNIYTTLPQFIGTFISAVVFAILEPGKSPELSHGGAGKELPKPPSDGPNAIGVCLFLGAISGVGAAYATRRLRHL